MFELHIKSNGELYNQDNKAVFLKPCFPSSHIDKYISVRDEEGKELHFIEDLSELEEAQETMIRELIIEHTKKIKVLGVESVEDDIEIRTYNVNTTSGKTRFHTRMDDWPKMSSVSEFLLTDINGDEFIFDISALEQDSLKKISFLLD